jgi:hypothetical protein
MADDPIWGRRLLAPPRVDSIGALGPSGITLRITARVAAVHRWTAVGELRRRLLAAFREQGLPFVPSGATTASVPQSAQVEPPASAALDTTPGPGPAEDDLAQGTE